MTDGRPVLLVAGAGGQVGGEIAAAPGADAFRVVALDRAGLDVADAAAVERVVAAVRPDVVVNAAAYTAVDQAEREHEAAFAINRDGPAHLAAACARRDVPLLHISTDYVFDGTKDGPYVEDDAIGPLNVYGASKAAGEAAVREMLPRHVILRTSWVYGARGRNFVKTMLRLGAQYDRLTVVDDQHGSPSAAAEIAAALVVVARRLVLEGAPRYGTFHFAGQGVTTWYGFAQAIFAEAAAAGARTPAELVPIPSSGYPTPARRPTNSVLDCARFVTTFGFVPRHWQESLRLTLAGMPVTA